MNKEFIPYEIALELKELGFNEPCLGYYIELKNPPEGILTIDKCENNIDGCLAPLKQQVFRWFREKYGLFYDNLKYINKQWKFTTYSSNIKDYNQSDFYDTYEEAELECIKKLIEIVKK
jgi:hypothetical protein